MTENEAIERIKSGICNEIGIAKYCHDSCMHGIEHCAYSMAIQALEEIQQYRAYKEIFEGHFSKEALELLSDKEEFSKWIERGKWIAKKCDEINRKLEGFETIGTIEEVKALKEKSEPMQWIEEDMGEGETLWKCPDCNEYWVLMEGTPKDNQYNFCPKCGRALKLSE